MPVRRAQGPTGVSASLLTQLITLQVLKEGGAHIDQHSVNVNGLKETALHCAIRHQHLDTAQLLLELGADATIHGHYFNLYQGSALDYAEQVKTGPILKGFWI
jgi:Ankyrin repeat.